MAGRHRRDRRQRIETATLLEAELGGTAVVDVRCGQVATESAGAVRVDPELTRLLRTLAGVTGEQAKLARRQQQLVAALVARGASWATIGEALGVSRQAAHRRFTA